MKNIKTILCIILILSLCLTTYRVNADPTIENITTNPVKPKPLSTFTIIATINGENIISVNVAVSECTDGPPAQVFVCHPNILMVLNDEGKYEAEVTLTGTQKSIDHVQYLFIINDNGTEYHIDGYKTYLDIESDLQNNTFIFGGITNLSSDGDSITFNAVNIIVISFTPFSFHTFSSGEYFEISKDYTGFIGVNFIFALVNEYIQTIPKNRFFYI